MHPGHGTGDFHVSEQELANRIQELGQQITADYAPEQLHVVGVLTGGFIFLADLVRQINLAMTIDFIRVSSYHGEFEPGATLDIQEHIGQPVASKHVLIVDDIVDTGRTVMAIRQQVLSAGAKSVKIATLLKKTDRREESVPIDYAGFDATGKFVYGFGLDRGGEDRNLPFVTSVALD